VELMAIDKNCCWFEYKTGFVVSVARAVCITVRLRNCQCQAGLSHASCAFKGVELIAGRFVELRLAAV
jgi:hypothetical protein